MTLAPTLPTGPLEHPALDYDALRAEALELLDRLTDGRWTDRNPHDPGLTILEQLCYAITDLAYRATHSVPDLFAGGWAGPGPAEILTCDPVTEDDLRRLVLDEPGVQSVQRRPAELEPPVFFHAGSRELHLVPDPSEPDARPLALRGLTRLALQSDGTLPLLGSDDFHPSPLGTYLVAITMYEKLTGKDARDLPDRAYANGAALDVPASIVQLVQEAAHQANTQY